MRDYISRWNLTLFLFLFFSNKNSDAQKTQRKKNDNKGTSNDSKTIDMEDVRFNKFYFEGSTYVPPRSLKPLKKNDYPISGVTNSTLRLSDAVSVMTMDDYEVFYNVPRLIKVIGGLPSHPDDDQDAPFWNLREVIDVQIIRRQNPSYDSLYVKPDRWQEADLNQAAELVHNELPGSLQGELLQDIISGKYGDVNIDLNVIPYRCENMFLRKDFLLTFLNGWAMSVVGPHNFAAKWFAGRARPEEVVWLIHKGTIKGAPNDIVRSIQQMNLRSAAEFTAYDEGSPTHPSWPAMHAATASTSFWLSIVLDLNEAQLCQARLMDYAISYARTIAGVHYADDNIAGLNLAQEVLARAMPKFLRDKYDSNAYQVAEKIRQSRFDWKTFDPKNPCP